MCQAQLLQSELHIASANMIGKICLAILFLLPMYLISDTSVLSILLLLAASLLPKAAART